MFSFSYCFSLFYQIVKQRFNVDVKLNLFRTMYSPFYILPSGVKLSVIFSLCIFLIISLESLLEQYNFTAPQIIFES
jgi:hypothetical protein